MRNNCTNLTVLCDNYVQKPHLLAEHGLSFFIEAEKINILFDTGQGLAIEHNAKRLNIDLKSVDAVILSHGHYDHTGGLEEVLKDRSKAKIYAHPDILQAKYRKLKTGKMRYIGCPHFLSEEKKINFILNREPFWIHKKIFLTGQIPRKTFFENVEANFYVKKQTSWVKDNLLDDQALVVNTPPGLVLILGCAHSGLINTLRYVVEIAGRKDFSLITGGTHLENASEEKINKTITALREFKIEKLILSHCTGIPAFRMIREALGDKVFLGNVGEVVQLGVMGSGLNI